MIKTKIQWNMWVDEIIKDMKTCDVVFSHDEVSLSLARIIGFDNKALDDYEPLEIDLYNSLLGDVEGVDENLETEFHQFANSNSYLDESTILGAMKKYYPPCRTIFSLLPKGVKLSAGESEWFWTNLLLNGFTGLDGDTINLDWISLHEASTFETNGNGSMNVRGIDLEIINSLNDVYSQKSQGRFIPLTLN